MSESVESHRAEAHLLIRELIQSSSSPDSYKAVLGASPEALDNVSFRWNTADLISYIDGLEFDLVSGQRRLANWAATVRNILVFTPVALTWHAISVATSSFDRFLRDNPEVPANFLQFWQDGYGYLDPVWTIGSVANLDFLLVLGVIFLTGYVSFSTQRLKERVQAHLAEVDSKRAILRAKLLLIAQGSGGVKTKAHEAQFLEALTVALKNGGEMQSRQLLVSQLRAFLEELEQGPDTKTKPQS